MTTHALHDGFRHAATTLTNQVLAVIAVALCTLLGYQLFEWSRIIDLDALTSQAMSQISYSVASATSMHEYVSMLIVPAAVVGCMALGALYIWNQKEG